MYIWEVSEQNMNTQKNLFLCVNKFVYYRNSGSLYAPRINGSESVCEREKDSEEKHIYDCSSLWMNDTGKRSSKCDE